jgi:hypothetical protein
MEFDVGWTKSLGGLSSKRPSASRDLHAYVTVAQKFTALCQELKISPEEAWMAIGRLGGFGQTNISPSSASSSTSSSKDQIEKVSLSADQKKKCLEQAKKAKAKRMGLSPSEVNLTSTESKEAVRNFKQALQKGEKVVNNNTSSPKPATETKKEKEKKAPEVNSPPKTEPPPEGNNSSDSGRSTAVARLGSFRRVALKQIPTAVADPVFLNLLAYHNAVRKLTLEWLSFKKKYISSKMLNPLRNLPPPMDLRFCGDHIRRLESALSLRKDASTETYILMDENSLSFWDRDRPDSSACPPALQEALGSDVLQELEEASGSYPGAFPS